MVHILYKSSDLNHQLRSRLPSQGFPALPFSLSTCKNAMAYTMAGILLYWSIEVNKNISEFCSIYCSIL